MRGACLTAGVLLLQAQEAKLSMLQDEVQHMLLEQLTTQGREQMLLQVITDVERARYPTWQQPQPAPQVLRP